MQSGGLEGLEDLRGEDLERALAGSASHIDAAIARQLALIRVFDERGEWASDGAQLRLDFARNARTPDYGACVGALM